MSIAPRVLLAIMVHPSRPSFSRCVHSVSYRIARLVKQTEPHGAARRRRLTIGLRSATFGCGRRGSRGTLYRGMIDCGQQTVRNEGVLALYKGFVPLWMRLGPWALINWIAFENIMIAIGGKTF
ncbi:Mitochondrial uncoupling protein Bmcp [Eumeta japonica]|uniref:Mitochondrial uncoupling protein Bmcp n=1 Tax=Eumeta variegata TaxID=151549 RepID=A0A4C1UTD2_EUMVA|nr:Mitochondrial uncoupling protein Bmcp [Eumeta japonica]